MTGSELRPVWLDEPSRLAAVCERAARAGVLAIDTEADSLHSYFHKLCLVQLSFAGLHAIIDPLALGREGLRPLTRLLAEPGLRKLLHGADYDLRVLDRDLGVRVANVRDTQIAAQLLGEPQTSLAALVGKELGVALDKRFQRADWGERPLAPEMLAYAAGDTAHLEALAARLAARLRELGRLEWWEEECAALAEIHWEPPVEDRLAFERVKGGRGLRGAQRDRLAALFDWRERQARSDDVPPFKVLGAEAMVAIAVKAPATSDDLAAIPGLGRGAVRKHGAELLALVADPPPAPAHPARERFQVDRQREERLKSLRALRDAVAAELVVEPGVLAPRAALERAVDAAPATVEELAACLGRRWRAGVLAARLLPAIGAWERGQHAGAH